MAPKSPPTEHAPAAPPTAYESLQRCIPALKEVAAAVADEKRGPRGEPVVDIIDSLYLVEHPLVQSLVRGQAEAAYNSWGDPEAAASDGNLVGSHLRTFVNFELHRRKTFWVDPPLAWMLARTRLDIDGELLRLPFPCCAFIFNDAETRALGDALLRSDPAVGDSGTTKVVSVYLLQLPDTGGARELAAYCFVDRLDGEWPYVLGRSLWVEPRDRLDEILDSRLPDLDQGDVDPVFRSDPLKQLLHLLVNAVLYATSAGVEPVVLRPQAPVAGTTRRPVRGRSLRRALAREGRKATSDEVYFLPGKIDIRKVRDVGESQNRGGGGTLSARFLVRGHWRRAAADWADQRQRWIEPYWKGPELAAIIEREYRLKT